MSHRLLATIGFTFGLLGSALPAETMKFNYSGYGRDLRISSDAGITFANVFGGVLNMTYNGPTASIILDSFSADPTVAMANGNFRVQRTDSSIRGSKGLHAGYLVNKFAPAIFTGGNSGPNQDRGFALQVAIWEILTEPSNNYSLSSGLFRAQNSNGSALTSVQVAQINTYLNDFGQQVATYYKAKVNNMGRPCSQSVITAVPEPTSISALILGIGAIVNRRFKKLDPSRKSNLATPSAD